MTHEAAITVQALRKSYGSVEALRGIDLEVHKGEIFGFLGPNGAGKTTAIRCLLDLIRPNSGSARVLGIDPQIDPVAVRARVGYLPGELQIDDNLTGEQALRFFCALRGARNALDHAHHLAKRLDLDLTRKIKNLSKGNKQKVGVVQALMHRPELLLLDEPTGGLDPLMQQEVLDVLREARVGGTTVFFSSHIMSEVEAVADRVGMIRQGQMIEVAEVSRLLERALRYAFVRFTGPADLAALAATPGVRILDQTDGTSVKLQVEGDMDGMIKTLAGYHVADLAVARPTLEEVFLTYFKAERSPMEVH